MWMDVKYEPVTIKVVAYNKEKKVAVQKEIHTAGKPHKLILETDKTILKSKK